MADENKYNIKIECGTDFVLPFVWTDDNGNPYNLTGATVTAQLREYSGSPDALDFICTHNNAGGRIMIIMPNEVTKQITYSYGVYDVTVAFGSGVVKHPLYGEAKIQGAVTKPLDGEMLITVAIESYAKLPAQGLLNRLYYVYAEQMILRWNGTNYVSAFEFFELHPEGAWNEDTAYQKYATVTNAGSSYLALQNVPEDTDIHDTDYWLKLAEAGGAVNIDDTAGKGDTTVTWSADKIAELKANRDKVLYLFPQLYNENEDVTLIVTPTKTLLLDAGRSESWSHLEDYMDTLFDSGVITNIDIFILSHYHADHFGCLSNILQKYPHQNCQAWIPQNVSNASIDTTGIYNSIKNLLTNNNVTYTEVTDDITVPVDEYNGNVITDFTIWNGSTEDYAYYDSIQTASYNHYSLVVMFRHGNQYSVIPGDAYYIAQKNMVEKHNVPHLFLYRSNHHNCQNDDYVPFLQKINPENFVISMGRLRYTNSAYEYDYKGNRDVDAHILPDSRKFFLGYSSAAFATDGNSNMILEGNYTPSVVNQSIHDDDIVEIYVNNGYDGEIHDGTQAHPYVEIREALRFVRDSIKTVIRVASTATPYMYFRINNFKGELSIKGDSSSNKAIVHGMNLNYNPGTIRLENLSFQELSVNTNPVNTSSLKILAYLYAEFTTLMLANCEFLGPDGRKIIDDSVTPNVTYNAVGINSASSNLTLTDCTYSKLENGIYSNGNNRIIFRGGTFTDINRGVLIPGGTTSDIIFRNGTYSFSTLSHIFYLGSNSNDPIRVQPSNAETFLPYLQAKAVSYPFYFSKGGTNYPLACISDNKIYDILTGTQIVPTPSE